MLPGRRPVATDRWFNRFATTTEERDDLYLVHPQLGETSVKVRGSSLLELKVQQDDSRVLDVPGFGSAGVRFCEKWSFFLAVAGGTVPAAGSWKQVSKSRRLIRFSARGEPVGPDGLDGEPAACVELTDIRVDGHYWWTVALEADGSGRQAWDAMEAAARAVFADPPLADVYPHPSDAVPYSEWLLSHYYAGRAATSDPRERGGGGRDG